MRMRVRHSEEAAEPACWDSGSSADRLCVDLVVDLVHNDFLPILAIQQSAHYAAAQSKSETTSWSSSNQSLGGRHDLGEPCS